MTSPAFKLPLGVAMKASAGMVPGSSILQLFRKNDISNAIMPTPSVDMRRLQTDRRGRTDGWTEGDTSRAAPMLFSMVLFISRGRWFQGAGEYRLRISDMTVPHRGPKDTEEDISRSHYRRCCLISWGELVVWTQAGPFFK